MNIKQIKELYIEHGFRPNKRLGQNFLVDANIRDKILDSLSLDKDMTLLEIGPGFGVMTFEFARLAGKVIAVEKDDRICDIIGPHFERAGNIELINADILDVDLSAFAKPGQKLFVYGNVPYYITTPIVEKVIEGRAFVKGLYMVIQEELANRLVAPPGSRTYGSVSCFVQFYARARKLFRITKGCFMPRPQVGSCLIALNFLEEPSVKVKDEALMFKIIRAAFSQRRKKAINPLTDSGMGGVKREDWIDIFSRCGIASSSRAEALSLKDFADISDTFQDLYAS